MTIEQLEKGKKLAEEMQKLKEFHNAFHEPCMTCMKGLLAYRRGAKEPTTLSIGKDSKLYKLIDDYIANELEQVEKQFEEM